MLKHIMDQEQRKPENQTVAIQGFGNAGQYAASLGEELLGLRIIAVSDSRGGIVNKEGFDVEALTRHKRVTGSVDDFPGSNPISNEELLELDVTVFFPSALENTITRENAGNIKAKIVCELANGPTTPDADEILFKNKVFVLPDFLANAGGVTGSYFEQVQNTYNYYWQLDEVHRQLDNRMTRAFDAVYKIHKSRGLDMRTAAYLISVERVAAACKLRGWV